MAEHVDLIVLGAGSGNTLVPPVESGARTVIVEPNAFGGTCLNRGCIPTKMLVQSADVAYSAVHASRYGIDLSLTGVDWPGIRDRVFGRIDPIAEGGLEYREHAEHTTVVRGYGAFTGDRQIAVDTAEGIHEFTADQIVIAVGARPHLPQLEGLDRVPFHTSDTIMRIESLPERLGIIGGGYIASELAHVFGALGVKVTIVTRGDRLLKSEDQAISHAFTTAMASRFDCHFDATIHEVRKAGEHLELRFSSNGKRTEAAFDALLIAAGRTPNADRIGAAAGGIVLTDDGRVQTDIHGRTSANGVWALGDVSSPYQLKHVANHEARVVAHNLEHRNDPSQWMSFQHEQVPHAVFSHPQVASIGMTELQAQASGKAIRTIVRYYRDAAWGWALEDTESFVKLIMDMEQGTLLGAHIIGPHAATLLQPLVQMMRFGQRVEEVAKMPYYIHPAPSEVIEQALLELL